MKKTLNISSLCFLVTISLSAFTQQSNFNENYTPYLAEARNMDGIFQLVFKGWTIQQLQHPQYSPLYADLHNLPPALFSVGAIDPLADDTYFMEARWRSAVNKTYLAVYPESPHAFDQFPTQIAKLSRVKMYSWISDILK